MIDAIYHHDFGAIRVDELRCFTYLHALVKRFHDKETTFLVTDPEDRIALRQAQQPSLEAKLGQYATKNPRVFGQLTKVQTDSLLGFFKGIADARRRGASIEEEARQATRAATKGPLELEMHRDNGTHDAETLALLAGKYPNEVRHIIKSIDIYISGIKAYNGGWEYPTEDSPVPALPADSGPVARTLADASPEQLVKIDIRLAEFVEILFRGGFIIMGDGKKPGSREHVAGFYRDLRAAMKAADSPGMPDEFSDFTQKVIRWVDQWDAHQDEVYYGPILASFFNKKKVSDDVGDFLNDYQRMTTLISLTLTPAQYTASDRAAIEDAQSNSKRLSHEIERYRDDFVFAPDLSLRILTPAKGDLPTRLLTPEPPSRRRSR